MVHVHFRQPEEHKGVSVVKKGTGLSPASHQVMKQIGDGEQLTESSRELINEHRVQHGLVKKRIGLMEGEDPDTPHWDQQHLDGSQLTGWTRCWVGTTE